MVSLRINVAQLMANLWVVGVSNLLLDFFVKQFFFGKYAQNSRSMTSAPSNLGEFHCKDKLTGNHMLEVVSGN